MNLVVSGDYFKIRASLGAVTVIGDTFGSMSGMLAGQGQRGVNFQRLTLVDETGFLNIGSILVSDGTFIDDRINGEVSVIDGGKSRTLSGSAMMGYGATAGVAGNHAHIQLLNPTGSQRNLSLSQLNVFSVGTISQGIVVREYSTALTSLKSNGYAKKMGLGAVSVGQIRAQNNNLPLGVQDILVLDKSQKQYKLTEPIVLPEGKGIVVVNGVLGEDLGCTFEYTEDAL